MKKVFYKMSLSPIEEGLSLHVIQFVSIHETKCFHFCVNETVLCRLGSLFLKDGETKIQAARRMPLVKVFRIDKRGSRIAFETKELALKNLIMLKKLQLKHMARNTIFINEFIARSETINLNDQTRLAKYGYIVIPDTQRIVLNHLNFEG